MVTQPRRSSAVLLVLLLAFAATVRAPALQATATRADPSPEATSDRLVSKSAAYPLAIDSLVYHEQQVTASDGANNDQFGWSVALWGDTALVGVPYDGVGTNSYQGSVYVFTRSGISWSEQAHLTASDGDSYDFFGNSVALCGDTALVGAPGQEVGPNSGQGSVYVFIWDGTTWSQQAVLTASHGAAGDGLGGAVALWGDTALAGSNGSQGSVHVFARDGATWSEQAILTASDGEPGDGFGHSVALWEDTALVGAGNHTVGANPAQGSAYVFIRSETTWREQAHLIAADGAAYDGLGSSVALWDDTALVGADHDDVWTNGDQGSAYVFTRSGTTWDEQAHLIASHGSAVDYFGHAVALWNDTALVGAWWDDVWAFAEGSASIFTREGTVWSEQQRLTASDGAEQDYFGWSVALWEDTALVGAYWDDVGGHSAQGSAYFYNALPMITSITRADPSPTHASSVNYAVTFSEGVTGVDVPDFALTTTGAISGSAVTGVGGSGETYTVTVSTGIGGGTLRLDVPSRATITDLIGHPLSGLPYIAGETYTVDPVPVVTSITCTSSSPTSAPSVGFEVSFSENVTGVDTSDFALTTTGTISGSMLSAISGSGATYLAIVSTGSGSGTLRLDVPTSATVGDLTGNLLSNLPYTAGEAYTVDKAAPSVRSVTLIDPNPTSATSVRFALSFSEGVTGVDVTDFLPTTVGSVTDVAVADVSGSGATYTVTVSLGADNGTLRLDVPLGATIADLVGHSLAGLPYTDGEIYTVDALPCVTSIVRVDPNPTSASRVGFAVTFSEEVTGVDASDFFVILDGSPRGAAVVDVIGSGATYTVTVGTGTGGGTLGLVIPTGATVADLAGNPLSDLPYVTGETYLVLYATHLPLVVRNVP